MEVELEERLSYGLLIVGEFPYTGVKISISE